MNTHNSFNFKSGKSREASEILSFVKTIVVFVVAVVMLRGTVVEAFKIPSGSMIPTLKIGDYILVSKFTYGLRLPFMIESLIQWSSPDRGDVVVFTREDDPATPEDESETNLVKRVIGLPGDEVVVRNTEVLINNQKIPELYARWEEGGIREGNWGPAKVPENHIFLLGDNRDHSKDSRFWNNPFVDIKRLKGRAIVIYWSWDSMSRIGTLIR